MCLGIFPRGNRPFALRKAPSYASADRGRPKMSFSAVMPWDCTQDSWAGAVSQTAPGPTFLEEAEAQAGSASAQSAFSATGASHVSETEAGFRYTGGEVTTSFTASYRPGWSSMSAASSGRGSNHPSTPPKRREVAAAQSGGVKFCLRRTGVGRGRKKRKISSCHSGKPMV